MSPPYHVAFGINEEFADQLRVLWASLFAHHEKGALCLHVLHSGISPYQESHLRTLARKHQMECRFNLIPHSRVSAFPVKKNFPSSVQYHRLFIPEFMPSGINRVLYLDTDMLVCRDLTPLLEHELEGYTVGAVEDLDTQASCKRLGIPLARGYFNSGMLLMDLPAWNANSISSRVQDYLVSHRDEPAVIKYPDQDALNTVLQHSRKRLPLEWNTFACYPWFQPNELSPAQQAAVLNPGIIHFIGPEKPWLPSYATPYQNDYQHYARLAGVKFPRSFSPRAFWLRRKQAKQRELMRGRYQEAGLRNDF